VIVVACGIESATTNGAETGEETAPEEGQRKESNRTLSVLPLDQRLYRETGSRSRSSGGDTTGLRPDVEEIRYGASVGILASQSLRHCATATAVTANSCGTRASYAAPASWLYTIVHRLPFGLRESLPPPVGS